MWARTRAYCAARTRRETIRKRATDVSSKFEAGFSARKGWMPTHGLEDGPHEVLVLKRNTGLGEANHDGEVEGPGDALEDAVLPEAGVEEGCH